MVRFLRIFCVFEVWLVIFVFLILYWFVVCGGESCGPIARYVQVVVLFQGRVFPSKIPLQVLNMVSSFPGGQAHVMCNRDVHEASALRALERYHDRLVSLVEAGSIECPLSTGVASHGNTHRNSFLC